MASKKEYISENPRLMAEWNWEKNVDFEPTKLTVGSEKKVWWKCSKGHEWQARISDRNKGGGCPYCSGKKVLKGYNDLQTLNPSLSKEWDYEKNDNLKPEDFTLHSGKKVWWKCSKGHKWQASICQRSKGSVCPFCSGRYAIKGYNDLQTVNPTLASEWNYEKNDKLTPIDVLPNSNKKVWWKCSKGHEWQATISDRNKGTECPSCISERKTSFPEYAIEYYLKNYGLEAIHLYKEKGYELDIFIPSKNIAIEYDGYLWHKNKTKKDMDKNRKCANDGIKLFRIREGLQPLNDTSLDYIVQQNQKDLSIILEKVLSEIIGKNIDIDLERDTIAIENLREFTEKENSLLFFNPKIAREWDYEKNGDLKPEHFTVNSHKKVWWKCSNGHKWQSTIGNRNSGNNCPICSGKKVLKGYNDLQTINPYLAKEWNYEKNDNLTPEHFTSHSGKKVWWKCSKGHEWQATVSDRSKGTGCPQCSGRVPIKGENDLQTVNPTLAKEWDFEKNEGGTPIDFLPNSEKKIWWKCDKGHEWQARIAVRNKGCKCPYCTSRKVLIGYNDLQTVSPNLASEWNYEKNNGLNPTDIMPNSNKKVWWKCSKGHEWQARIGSRNIGRGCPQCAIERRKGVK